MVYTLSGVNAHFKSEWVRTLRKGFEGYQYILLDGSDTSKVNVSSLDSLLSQVSLFETTQKIVHIRSWMDIVPSEYILSIVDKLKVDKEIIIILDSNEKIRSNAKILKLLDTKNNIIADAYSINKLQEIVLKILKDGGIEESSYALSVIMEKVEKEPLLLCAEAEKLSLLNRIKAIKKSDIDELIIPSVTYSIWEFLTNATNGKNAKALNILISLLENGESEYAILGMIAWNIKLLVVISSSGERGDRIIEKDFGYSSYSIRNARLVLKRYPLKKINIIYQKIVELEEKMKSGKIEPRLGLFLLTMVF